MNILITAGNTVVPIDRVRCITNVFTGRTGARIALEAHARGQTVCLLTSHPEAVADVGGPGEPHGPRWAVQAYRTFAELREAMAGPVRAGNLDAVVHCAAVSDYQAAGIYAPAPETRFLEQDRCWESTGGARPTLIDRAAGKVKSNEPELWLRLVRTPKLIDLMRGEWGFGGVLVKFKLEVGIGDADLLATAERSRLHSGADLMVANTLEGVDEWAYVGPIAGQYQRVGRPELPSRLLSALERLHEERVRG